ncbi:hypothetical protein PUNSTDRAFT_49056 [Punctularia strigosozonata HHB-11173 SS5]|uniref:uncharacterized protein n=1 Tax=Punctularia strigosozonata (strain HHB-11173) TaxID=741275 RepID=UPI0004416A81|nr:uncharacterized protein PUNSTDRAFT_49056 [Punctularia strigosozonata HHB-11173 SS5]EIN14247.1 hypothetical protein PUNSTDRAFT_49056 [Punctularia strigosozonata HHB-11173 SS5]
MSLLTSTIIVLELLVASVLSIATWLFCGNSLLGHRLRISHVRLGLHALIVEGVRYRYTGRGQVDVHYDFSVERLSFRLHVPTPSHPRYASFGAGNLSASDPLYEYSLSEATLTLWVFPCLFGVTAGSWASLALSEFRMIVKSSRSTPWWVAAIRRNVVHSLLTGEVLRCDHFRSAARMQPLPSLDEYGHIDKHPEQDEVTIQTTWERLHLLNHEQYRMYTWQEMNSGLREDWVDGRGFLKIVSKDVKWVRVHKQEPLHRPSLWSIMNALVDFSGELLALTQQPSHRLDIYLSECSVVFQDFRIRDAELYKQGMALLSGKFFSAKEEIKDQLWDALVELIAP